MISCTFNGNLYCKKTVNFTNNLFTTQLTEYSYLNFVLWRSPSLSELTPISNMELTHLDSKTPYKIVIIKGLFLFFIKYHEKTF